MIQVFIDPRNKINYSSYYIQGLYDLYGKKNVNFSMSYFRDLDRNNESHSFDHYMAFIIKNGDDIKRFIIDYRDKTSVKSNAYNWCDCYAKINFRKHGHDATDSKYWGKIISITPGFSIKIWNVFESIYYCMFNLYMCKFKPLEGIKKHVIDYIIQVRNLRLIRYKNIKSDNNYIFHLSTLWFHEFCQLYTNPLRKKFIEECLKINNIKFEGGFVCYKPEEYIDISNYKNLLVNSVSRKFYLEKLKKSAIAFNTPAVHSCHGWKLGEYLALGKAIISTPLSNELPIPLMDNENIIIVSNEKEMFAKITNVINDNNLKNKLEKGSKKYFDEFACPLQVINRINNYNIDK